MKKIFTIILYFSLSQISFAQSEMDIFSKTKVELLTWNEIISSRWEKIDKDNNNLLQKSELQSISIAFNLLSFKYFKKIDLNNDQYISKQELFSYSNTQENKQKSKINRAWNKLDINKNYQISLEESKANSEIYKIFNRADKNHDKNIDPEEFLNFYNKTFNSKLLLN